MKRHIIHTFWFIFVLLFQPLAWAASNPGYRLCRAANPGCTTTAPIVAVNSGSEISEWCKCYILTNTSSDDVFVPTNTEAEYRAFLQNPPPNVTRSACATNGGYGEFRIVAAATSQSIRGCDRIQGTVDGAGGGGGARTNTNANGGNGGTGGRVTVPLSTITTTSTSVVTVNVATGGEGGECRSGSLGGNGGYAGGRGSNRSTTVSAANNGQPGAGTTANGGSPGAETSDQQGGVGKYGGGGGGGDANTNDRSGGGGGGATVVTIDSTEVIIAGGGAGGGGTRGSTGEVGGNGGHACNGTVSGQNGTSDGGSARAGSGGGGGACYSAYAGSTYAASGGALGPRNTTCVPGTGGNGAVSLTFTRSTALP